MLPTIRPPYNHTMMLCLHPPLSMLPALVPGAAGSALRFGDNVIPKHAPPPTLRP